MRLGKGLKKNSDLSLWSRTLLILISGLVSLPIQVHADPNVGDIPLPPVSFTRVTDTDTLIKIGLDGFGAACCERARCPPDNIVIWPLQCSTS